MISFPLPHLLLIFLSISLPSYNTRIVHLARNDAANTTREGKGLKCAEDEAGHRKQLCNHPPGPGRPGLSGQHGGDDHHPGQEEGQEVELGADLPPVCC